jgi:hypothetical protein
MSTRRMFRVWALGTGIIILAADIGHPWWMLWYPVSMALLYAALTPEPRP